MKIVLATSPSEEDQHGVRSLPPLSLGYLAAAVKNLPGATVLIVDAYGEALNVPQATERILALSPDLVGISATSFCFKSGVRLVSRLKAARPDLVTVMGGYHPTQFDELLLKELPDLDLVLRGEGDRSFPELCRRLIKSEAIDGAPGLSYRAQGQIVRGTPQQIDDLDALPFPERNLFNYEAYFHQFGGFPIPAVPPLANVASSRGCPYHCTFCPKLFPQWRYRLRSAENVFQELLELRDAGFQMVLFQDENFSHDIARVEKLCHLIIEHRLPMRFSFQGTIHLLPESTFQLMHRAGFDSLFVGVESGSDAQLRQLGKPAGSKALAEDIRRAKRAHMLVVGFFMFCGPQESEADFQATQNFITEVRPHFAGGNDVSIHPQALLWEKYFGAAPPESLERSAPRFMREIPGEHTKEVIRRRRRELRRAFSRSWLDWRRISDIIDLLTYNGTIRQVIKRTLRNAILPRQKWPRAE
jgi:anaerobic magnesium-protoporphyrin IX monomethyl ester cyclase